MTSRIDVEPRTASAELTRDAVVTLTKWVLGDGPNMAGVVGGDVGAGSYTGEILTFDPTVAQERVTEIEALYHFKGAEHAFDAHVNVRLYNRQGTGTIGGIVTDGWMEGASISGTFKTIECEQAEARVAYYGVMHLHMDDLGA